MQDISKMTAGDYAHALREALVAQESDDKLQREWGQKNLAELLKHTQKLERVARGYTTLLDKVDDLIFWPEVGSNVTEGEDPEAWRQRFKEEYGEQRATNRGMIRHGDACVLLYRIAKSSPEHVDAAYTLMNHIGDWAVTASGLMDVIETMQREGVNSDTAAQNLKLWRKNLAALEFPRISHGGDI